MNKNSIRKKDTNYSYHLLIDILKGVSVGIMFVIVIYILSSFFGIIKKDKSDELYMIRTKSTTINGCECLVFYLEDQIIQIEKINPYCLFVNPDDEIRN